METKMKQISNYLSILALVLMSVLAFGCSDMEDEPVVDPNTADSRIVTLTTTLSFDNGAKTRALTEDGVKTFVAGEKVAVIYWHEESYMTKVEYELKAADIRNGGKTADMTFSLTNPKDGSSNIAFVYPASLACTDYAILGEYYNMEALRTQQDGSFNNIAQWDAAIGTGNMTVSGGTATLPSGVSLKNPFCIVGFSLKDGNGTALNNKIKELNVTAGNYNYNIKRAASADQIYLAMKPVEDEKVTITYKDGDDLYSRTVTTTLGANKIYPINVTLAKINPCEIPLTLKAVTNGKIEFELRTSLYGGNPVKYTRNGVEEGIIYTNTKVNISVYAGDEISFYGNNSEYYQFTGEHTYHSNIKCITPCLIYGNVMSLVKGRKKYAEDSDESITNDFATATELTGYNAFEYLFKDNQSNLLNHALPIVLPATTLTPYCYRGMFTGCHGLTMAPELPATALQPSCYREMFNECWNLTKAPALPATEMKSECYRCMFMDCEKLVEAPILPSTQLADYCYSHMFYSCDELTNAPDLPATQLAEYCYNSMFLGCGKLTKAPDLPAETLAAGCYNYIFYNCCSLNYLKCLAASGLNEANTKEWLGNVSATGTFVCPSSTDVSEAGIPAGWSRVNYVAP